MENWHRDRIESRWGPCILFNDFHAYLSSPAAEGVSAIRCGAPYMFVRLKRSRSPRLVVVFGAAALRSSSRSPPFFNGLGLTEALDASVLLIDDIAHQFGEDVGVGWHVGSAHVNSQTMIPAIIKHVVDQLECDNVVLTGGSAGGFAALFFGSKIRCKVMAVNPQTDILRYYQRHVQLYASRCFGWSSGSSLKEVFNDRIVSLPQHLADQANVQAVYFQNDSDTHHVERHAFPLMRALGMEAQMWDCGYNGIQFCFRNWGHEHAPMPPSTYADCLSHILDNGLSGVSEAFDASRSRNPLVDGD